MGGPEMIKLYRFAHPSHCLPFLILTANAPTEAREESQTVGANAFLTKPIDPQTLLTQIAQLVPQAAQRPPANRPAATVAQPHTALNLATLTNLESLGQSTDFVNRLIHGFLADTETLLGQMQQALLKQYYSEFKDLAHALKGSAGSVGAETLHQLATAIGPLTHDELHAQASARMHAIVNAYESARYDLLAYLEDRRAAPLRPDT